MMDMQQAWKLEQKLHPEWRREDQLKFIQQACLGPAHMIEEEDQSLKFLQIEKKMVTQQEHVQQIGPFYVRVPLSMMKEQDLPLWNILFIKSATYAIPQEELFDACLNQIPNGISDLEKEKLRQGIHHSEHYRQRYQPHYRVIKKEYVDFFPMIKQVYEMFKCRSQLCFAIDGPCASGKSTFAILLQELFDLPLFHMDDYFLPPHLKSKDRLCEPGGNVDYERCYQEILAPFQNRKEIVYRPYDCKEKKLFAPIHIPFYPYIVLEGSYAHHPYFQNVKTMKLFLNCCFDIQKERLKQRSPYLYERFVQEWIPMEETYFQTFSIKEHCDCLIDTSTF